MATLRSTEWFGETRSRFSDHKFKHDRLISATPGPRVVRFLKRPYVGFCYHLISERMTGHVGHVYDTKSPAELSADLDYLSDAFGVADPSGFAVERAPVPSRPGQSLLTFDDGLAEWADPVAPLFERHGMRGIFFVTTDAIDNRTLLPDHRVSIAIDHLLRSDLEVQEQLRQKAAECLGAPDSDIETLSNWLRTQKEIEQVSSIRRLLDAWDVDEQSYLATVKPYLTSAQVSELSRAGFVMGAHGLDHRKLHTLAAEEVERQVVQSCERVRDLTGQKRVPFAFPYSMRVARTTLDDIAGRNPCVGAYFGTGGLKDAPPGFYERIVADWRWRLKPGRSNLRWLINDAVLSLGIGTVVRARGMLRRD